MMDQAKNIPTVLLMRRTYSEEDSGPWLRLFKALKGFTQPALEIRDEPISPEEMVEIAKGFDHVLLELPLGESFKDGEHSIGNLTFVTNDPIAWSAKDREEKIPLFARYSCLGLNLLSATDLIRVLHLLFMPKRLAGVVPLMEKNSLIVAEKVQSTEHLGALLDKLCAYFSRSEGFTLQKRIFDLRQTLSALLLDAFRRAEESAEAYPTVEFQVGMNRHKIAINLRFPLGTQSPESISRVALNGEDPLWHQAWASSDLSILTHHTQYNEIEWMMLLHQEERAPYDRFRPLLLRKSHRSVKKENLFTVSQNYDFRVLSDIRLRDKEELLELASEEAPEFDLNGLPEETVEKIAKLSRETLFLREQTTKKDELLRDAITKVTQLNKSLGQKQNEFVKVTKSSVMRIEAMQRKINELEKTVEKAAGVKAIAAASVDNSAATSQQENIVRLEQSLRALENEKVQLNERANREQKKVAALEQKYSTLYRDIGVKDKELAELKSQVLKMKKELATAAAESKNSGVNVANQDATAAKLKDAEAKEFVLKQELRKLAFKAENHEKNVKAIQLEAAEKTKLLEQKLQAAKAKELELIKKVEDLSALLKKASKAA